jgi:hypothetical protein
MKIIVKTLNGKQLPLEIESDWTVRKVKEEIEKCHELKADTLKLIAYGKVLDNDEKSAADFSIKDGDFVVAMVQKPKPAPKAKPAPVEEKKDEEMASQTQPVAATNPPAQANPEPVAQAQPAAAQQQPVAA